jgi:hypothetical protein
VAYEAHVSRNGKRSESRSALPGQPWTTRNRAGKDSSLPAVQPALEVVVVGLAFDDDWKMSFTDERVTPLAG